MNEEQKLLLVEIQIKEKKLADAFKNKTNRERKLQKILLHRYGLQEFKRLGKERKRPVLFEEVCSPDCLFCHPKLLRNLKRNHGRKVQKTA